VDFRFGKTERQVSLDLYSLIDILIFTTIFQKLPGDMSKCDVRCQGSTLDAQL